MADRLITLMRFIAFAVDVLLLTLISWPIKVFFLDKVLHDSYWGLFDILLFFIYRVLMHTIFGQTIGKRIWNLKVVDIRSLKKPGFIQVVLREIIPLVILLCLNLPLRLGVEKFYHHSYGHWLISGLKVIGSLLLLADIIVMFSNQLERALHDYLGKSIIVCFGVIEPIDVDDKNGMTL